jgi:hypothetical protein
MPNPNPNYFPGNQNIPNNKPQISEFQREFSKIEEFKKEADGFFNSQMYLKSSAKYLDGLFILNKIKSKATI